LMFTLVIMFEGSFK